MGTGACAKCNEPVSTEAETCPHCGFTPSEKYKNRRRMFDVLGVVFTLSIIGAPLAIVFYALSWNLKRKAKNTPLTKSPV